MVAQSSGGLWRLSRADFRAAVQSGRADPSLLLVKCFKGCELLEPLTNGQLMVMADLMQPVRESVRERERKTRREAISLGILQSQASELKA